MLDLTKLKYRVVVVTADGAQLDITEVCSALGWSEEERQLSAKITCKLACVDFKGKSITELVKPFSPVFIYADIGEGFVEVIRGVVQKWELIESNGEFTLDIDAADEVQALRQSQDDFFSAKTIPQPRLSKKFLVIGAYLMNCKSRTLNMPKKFIAVNICVT